LVILIALFTIIAMFTFFHLKVAKSSNRLPPNKPICKLNLYLGFTPANRPHPNRSVAFWRVPT
jgi:hypothetical protein